MYFKKPYFFIFKDGYREKKIRNDKIGTKGTKGDTKKEFDMDTYIHIHFQENYLRLRLLLIVLIVRRKAPPLFLVCRCLSLLATFAQYALTKCGC